MVQEVRGEYETLFAQVVTIDSISLVGDEESVARVALSEALSFFFVGRNPTYCGKAAGDACAESWGTEPPA